MLLSNIRILTLFTVVTAVLVLSMTCCMQMLTVWWVSVLVSDSNLCRLLSMLDSLSSFDLWHSTCLMVLALLVLWISVSISVGLRAL